ncbi:RNA polymerase II degradation factor 1-like [Triticum urartu]|uniref:RNA polymerase II degradation factor 1-like n=2 Tax=Triticum urartu TaxID=4572 RepID=UPI002043B747|nr:RNA polymerase II degradation factor 1-like [Triticum urartu]XP_048542291.1 RNA polymerase II degradation factor 1-like [Triticum urartu]
MPTFPTQQLTSLGHSSRHHQPTNPPSIATSTTIPCLRFLMAAATNTKPKRQHPAPVVDPKFEWADKAGTYVLRLSLEGFKKGDFRVQVDGAGRLTVSGARPGATPGSLHKVFQLPSTASLDDIAGRFESGVLTLTVPKRAYSAVPAPTSIEEIKRDKPGVAKEDVRPPPTKDVDGSDKKAASGGDSTTKPKEEIAKEEDVSNKAMDEATKNAQQQKQPEEASNHKQEEQKLAPEPEAKKEQEVKPEAPEKPAPEPEVAIDEKDKAVVDQESLAAGVRRRIEEEKAKAAAAAMEAKAVLEKKATACSGWKQRVAGGLEQLTDMKWADSVVEKARNNKEVVAIAIAAFSLGFFVSHKLFRK